MNYQDQFDVFISYSSKDEKEVAKIQKFIEGYSMPKEIWQKHNFYKLKAFRDKTDQGLTLDYQLQFGDIIKDTPNFLLVGSPHSKQSIPIKKEVDYFISQDKKGLNLALVDSAYEKSFPENIIAKYPKAIFADLRVLKEKGYLKWILLNKKKFKVEMLRIISSILSNKTGTEITFDQLLKREKTKTFKKKLLSLFILFSVIFSFLIYYFSTPAYAWHYTETGKIGITDYSFTRIRDNPAALFIKEVVSSRYEDDMGNAGNTTKVSIYQIDESGKKGGELKYNTLDGDFEDAYPEVSGYFAKLDSQTVFNIMGYNTNNPMEWKLDYKEEYEIKFQLNDSVVTNPVGEEYPYTYDSLHAFCIFGVNDYKYLNYFTDNGGKNWQVTDTVIIFPTGIKSVWQSDKKDGIIFIASYENNDQYDFAAGGIHKSTDFGKTWNTLTPFASLDNWNSFKSVIASSSDPNRFAVVVDRNDIDNSLSPFDNSRLIPSVWKTMNNGKTWKLLESGSQPINSEIINLIGWTKSNNLFATISNKTDNSQRLILYKKRKFWDRLFKRFDNV